MICYVFQVKISRGARLDSYRITGYKIDSSNKTKKSTLSSSNKTRKDGKKLGGKGLSNIAYTQKFHTPFLSMLT